ncbi:MAG: M1 family aminopeptidase [Acidobacteriota bacterium]
MRRRFIKSVTGVAAAALLSSIPAFSQTRRADARIDVDKYTIDAQVDPIKQALTAKVKMDFTPQDELGEVTLGLHQAMEIHTVLDSSGSAIPTSRGPESTIRLLFPTPLPKGKPASVTFDYAGKLTGNEESPVWGIKFAAIHEDHAYFMYPSRWFPVNDYAVDRFAMNLRVTVPGGYRVAGSGVETAKPGPDGGSIVEYDFSQQSYPGSFAVMKGDPQTANSNALAGTFFFRGGSKMAPAYGQEMGKAMEYFTGIFGLPPNRKLTIVETESGAPNGYSAPGVIFLSPNAIGTQVNTRLVANQIARQWWGVLLGPASRNHLWIPNGVSRYAELLYAEETEGKGALNTLVKETYVEALTVEQPPIIQSARLEDYSPEYWAVTAGKGAAVLHMLRGVMGDENFFKLLKAVPDQFAWKTISTEDFHKAAENIAKENLTGFFLQWIESSGAPEFALEYVTFRTKTGFRVNGKVTQDLDLFRMPAKLRIETEGNPEEKTIVISGTSTEFAVETFGKPTNVTLDPGGDLLKFDDNMRVAVAIRRGEQFVEISEFLDAIKEYEKALQVKRNSSLALYRTGEVYFLQNNLQAAADKFRSAIGGDLEPTWVEVWSHLYLGKIFDITGDRARAVNEYRQASRTKDNTQGALEEAEKYLQTPYERERRASN